MRISIPPGWRSSQYFMVTWLELQALNQYRRLLEGNLTRLIDERGDLTWDPPRDDDPGNLRLWLMQGPIDDLAAQAFRRSFLICLWAAFESCLVTIAKELARRKALPEPHLAGKRDFLKEAKRYFSEQLSLDLLVDGRSSSALHKLDRIRKALVHGYGTKGAVTETRWNQLVKDSEATEGLDTSPNYLRIEASYLESAFNDVFAVTVRAIEHARGVIEATEDP